MRHLILGTGLGFENEISTEEQIVRIHNAGWDGIFTGWDESKGIMEYARIAKDNGLIYQSVHAPFEKADKLWEADPAGDAEMARQIRCVHDCAEAGVPLIVMHAIIGFDKNRPTNIGVKRFLKIVEEAEACGISIAFENTEGPIYLDTLLEAFSEHKNVGFCIDTGHEMCYNFDKDMTALYGHRLIVTHINDNLGVRDFEGRITLVKDFGSWLNILGLGLWATMVSNITGVKAIRRIGPTHTSILGALQPVTAVILGVLFLGEHLYLRSCIGITLILVAVSVVVMHQKKR
mgnify:CR=1 FL=1